MTSGGRELEYVGCDSFNYQPAVSDNNYRCVEGGNAKSEGEGG
jgi:hypothetical protein